MDLSQKIDSQNVVIVISGILVPLLIAFPFCFRNEAYEWLVYLDSWSFTKIMAEKFPPILGYRPLAQFSALILYKITPSSPIQFQIFNIFLFASALSILFKNSANRYLFSVLTFLTALIFFTAFYFLLNIQGIFYSPILLLTAYFISRYSYIISKSEEVILFFLSCLVAFIHPLIIPIYISFQLTNIKLNNKKRVLLKFISVLFAIFLMSLLGVSNQLSEMGTFFSNLTSSLYNLELKGYLSFFPALIILLLVATNKLVIINKQSTVGIFFFLSGLFYLINFPISFLLISILLYLTTLNKNYLFALLLLCGLMLPSIAPSGAASKNFLWVFILPFIISSFYTNKELDFLLRFRKTITSACIFLIISGTLIRIGISIPLLNNITRPLTEERIKSWQLFEMSNWLVEKRKLNNSIILVDGNRIEIGIMKNRQNIPPTNQAYFDKYLNYIRIKNRISINKDTMLIKFGYNILEKVPILHRISDKTGYQTVLYRN